MQKTITALLLLVIYTACTVRTKPTTSTQEVTHSSNKFNDPVLQAIVSLQDERKTPGLLEFLDHANPVYRKEAAIALASVQDTLAIPKLANLLRDTVPTVKQAAAYALGQMRHPAAAQPLITVAATETSPEVLATMLAATGKCITQEHVAFFEAYVPEHPLVMAGLSEGIYRAGLKEIHSEKLTQKIISLLEQGESRDARFWAAHALARHPATKLDPYADAITRTVLNDPDTEICIAAIQAMTKVSSPGKAAILAAVYRDSEDYRIKVSALRALKGAEFEHSKQLLFTALQDTNANVVVTAATFIRDNAPAKSAAVIAPIARQLDQPRAKAYLFAYLLKNAANKQAIREEMITLYKSAEDIYYKGFLLEALQHDIKAFPFVKEETFQQGQPILATYGLESMIAMRKQKAFPKELIPAFNNALKQAISQGDPAMAGIAAGIITEPALNFRAAYKDFSFIQAARDRMVLPRDVEAYIALQAAVHYLENKPAPLHPELGFNHPINWQQVKEIPVHQQVLVKTSKGDFVLQLFVEAAPGSVASFVELVQQGFYNQKSFHRVVPNFVVQGGDPRGDGWGSGDYSLRSEFAPLHYQEGYVGLASAGKDTESCQWFITHNATPHLDGRYTIFAKVISGMEVVHQLEIGDTMEEVRLVKAEK